MMATHESPAELIRRAVRELRDLAAGAGSGYIDGRDGRPRWEVVDEQVVNDPDEYTADGGVSWGDTGHQKDPRPVIVTSWIEDAAFIAAFDPTVALAVADWLEAAAEDEETWRRQRGRTVGYLGENPALAVARALLRVDANGGAS